MAIVIHPQHTHADCIRFSFRVFLVTRHVLCVRFFSLSIVAVAVVIDVSREMYSFVFIRPFVMPNGYTTSELNVLNVVGVESPSTQVTKMFVGSETYT